jgi:hypothetical protein
MATPNNPTLRALLEQVSSANPSAPVVAQPVAQGPTSGRLTAEATAFQESAPGLSLFKQLRSASVAENETKNAAAQKQALIKSMAADLQSKNYQGALAKYAQIDPEGVKSLLPQMSQIDPSLKGMMSFADEGSKTAAQTEYGTNARQLLDAQLASAKQLKSMELKNKAEEAKTSMTPGEIKSDEEFAKLYVEDIGRGGSASAVKS